MSDPVAGSFKKIELTGEKEQRLLFDVKNVTPAIYISMGNSKLGYLPNFNLPARSFLLNGTRVVTCPGASLLCRRVCYAQKGMYTINKAVPLEYAANYLASLQPDFVEDMIEAIRKAEDDNLKNWKRAYGKEPAVKLFRLHTSGDFYSADYAEKWLEIAKELPEVTFYAYTKAWIHFSDDGDVADIGMSAYEVNALNDAIMGVLEEVNALPNFQILLSTDETTGPIPEKYFEKGFKEAGINRTYAANGTRCLYQTSEGVWLPHASEELAKLRSQLIEEGMDPAAISKALEKKRDEIIGRMIKEGKIRTCDSCGFCWDKKRYANLNVYFLEH